MSCCTPRFYGKVFTERMARRDARRYRKHGLRGSARTTADWLGARTSPTLLEVGGGVGAIGVELLRAGTERAVDLELSPSYEPVARELAAESGVGDRFEFRVGDIVHEEVEPADAVVMHRVLCCYPDGEALLRAGARSARRYLVVTLPRDAWWTRAGVRTMNTALAIARLRFRTYVHPVDALVGVAQASGFTTELDERGRVWQTIAFVRAA